MFAALNSFRGKLPDDLPDWNESLAYIRGSKKESAHIRLARAEAQGDMLVQPRCGVGGQDAMADLLVTLEANAAPDILSLTIDAHTRLGHFDVAADVLARDPAQLNGYPLVAHGWRKGRHLNELVRTPIEVRHGSPDARVLFETAIASGLTSFEGGGLGYNIPYSKNVPIADSLAYWREVDALCGELAREGIIVDREFFGTLTAVLMPPSIGIAIALLEAVLAAQQGARCLSIACCQTGNMIQDIAALRAIRTLGKRYLPPSVDVFPVFHEFMGAFPSEQTHADALIVFGALAAKAGGAVKVINKTSEEAYGVPTTEANILGIRKARLAKSWIFSLLPISRDDIEEEQEYIEREVEEIIMPVLEANDREKAIVKGFDAGTLDVPFSASRFAQANVLPMRDKTGAIRYFRSGNLPFSEGTLRRNRALLDRQDGMQPGALFDKIRADILYFSKTIEDRSVPAV